MFETEAVGPCLLRKLKWGVHGPLCPPLHWLRPCNNVVLFTSSRKRPGFFVFVSTKQCYVFICSNREAKNRVCIENAIYTVNTDKTYNIG